MFMKNVLITGAATGLGAALVAYFVENGYRVWATYRSTPLPKDWETRYPDRIQSLYMDISDEAGIQKAVGEVADFLHKKGEKLNLLVNNAAVFSPGPVLELSAAQIMAEFRTNALGPLLLIRYLRPLLAPTDHRCATIVNIGSYITKAPLPFIGVYTASKIAMQSLMRTLQLELFPYQLKSVNILLGMVQTGVVDKQLEKVNQFAMSDYLPYLLQRAKDAQKLATRGCTAEYAAQRIFAIAHSPHPSVEYFVSKNAFLLRLAAMLASTSLYRAVIKHYYFTLPVETDKTTQGAVRLPQQT